MANVLISLVGGRPLPNIMLAQHVRPDHHYLIVSRDSVGAGRDLEKTLAALPAAFAPKESFVVEPYALQETLDACQTIIARHPDDRILLNTTLGPKTMAFGAYDAGKALRDQGGDAEVCYLARDQLVCLFNNANERVQIGLREYCTSYGWEVSWKGAVNDSRLPQITGLFGNNLELAQTLLQIIREPSQGKGKRTCRIAKPIPDAEFALLKQIEEIGLLSNVRRDANGTVWTIVDQQAGEVVVDGDWLEYLVYTCADSLRTKSDAHLFSECSWGLLDTQGKGEIDFAGVYQGQLIIASCKTERKLRREQFEELRSKMDQLGKGMCSGLLVSTVSRASRAAKDLADYEKWAQLNQIVLVLAEQIPDLPAILKKIALADDMLPPRDVTVFRRI